MRSTRHGRIHGHRHRHHDWKRLDREQKIEHLEEHQRDLEQRAADVADAIKRLKEEPADA
jgi:hypothetical protein